MASTSGNTSVENMQMYLPGRRTIPASRHAEEDWERNKSLIVTYYLGHNLNLSKVIRLMKDQYDFHATEQQYKKKFRDWGIRKNNPSFTTKDMDYMLQTMAERNANGKPRTGWRLNGRMLEYLKMRRLFRSAIRSRIDARRVIEMEPLSPCPGLSPITPEHHGCEPHGAAELFARIFRRPRSMSSPTRTPFGPPQRSSTVPATPPNTDYPYDTISPSRRIALADDLLHYLESRYSPAGLFAVETADDREPGFLKIIITCNDCNLVFQYSLSFPPGTTPTNLDASLRNLFHPLSLRFEAEHISTSGHRNKILERFCGPAFTPPPLVQRRSFGRDYQYARDELFPLQTSTSWQQRDNGSYSLSSADLWSGTPVSSAEGVQWGQFVNFDIWSDQNQVQQQQHPRVPGHGLGLEGLQFQY